MKMTFWELRDAEDTRIVAYDKKETAIRAIDRAGNAFASGKKLSLPSYAVRHSITYTNGRELFKALTCKEELSGSKTVRYDTRFFFIRPCGKNISVSTDTPWKFDWRQWLRRQEEHGIFRSKNNE